ncbi:MAG: hypothetical protein K2L11_09370 [Muribaculaceae bacterium]|nr:hypothetical protein [Muribaculaceae bacterium]
MIEFDTDKLSKALMELEPKRRMQAMKGAFRKAANKVKKQAAANLRQTGIHNASALGKGIRSAVWKKKAGFRVTIGTKKGKVAKGWHTNRRGQTLPILIWMEKGTKKEGTEDRQTKTKTKVFKRKRKGHPTGRIKPYGFMDKTKSEMKDKITDELRLAMEENIMKALKKYGK